MGFLVIERHVFYAEGKEYSDPRSAGQTHLVLRHQRVPWENSFYKSVVYLSGAQLSTPPSSGGRAAGIETMREYFLGSKKYAHPRLIVGDIHTPNEIMSKSQIGQLLVGAYAKRYSAFAREHTIRRPTNRGNEGWFIFDPSQPGRKALKRDTYLRLARAVVKEMSPRKTTRPKMFTSKDGRRRRYDTSKIIVLGMGYRLAYYHGPTAELADMGADNKLQRRVNQFLSRQAGSVGEAGKEQWFVLGKFKTAYASVRARPTPRGRQMKVLTYRQGKGLRPVAKEESTAIRPLFVVNARTEQEAKEEAQKRFSQMMNTASVQRRKAVLQQEKWIDSGEAVIPRRIWNMHRPKH